MQEMENLFLDHAEKWANLVKNRDKEGFAQNMNSLKNKYATSNTNFGQAYENMYKIMEWL
jgi:hypothetical protein